MYFLHAFKFAVATGLMLVLCGCAASRPYIVNLMPAPEIYDEETLTPFSDLPGVAESPYWGMLYATDRAPIDPNANQPSQERFYGNDRGYLVRLGIADITLGKGEFSWEEAKRISLAKNRTDKYPLKVAAVDELGALDRSFSEFETSELLALKSREPAQRFAALINEKLALSAQKDIFIYIHGYKVVFDNPILVATELWHFLGYEGVFIAYAWPSTPSPWAYFADAETAMTTAYSLRVFLEYLAKETNAERIHIIGYSQGTRLVTQTLYNIALMNHDKSREAVQKRLRIGHVVLIGSDVDREMMGTFIADGLLKVPQHLTVYVSERDQALDLSTFFFGRKRLGQMFAAGEMALTTAKFLWETPEVSVINVTAAEGATSGNGHSYFRSSPWASSDMLMALRYGLRPGERGLVRSNDLPIWIFPEDYIDRLRTKLIEVNPELVNTREQGRGTGIAKRPWSSFRPEWQPISLPQGTSCIHPCRLESSIHAGHTLGARRLAAYRFWARFWPLNGDADETMTMACEAKARCIEQCQRKALRSVTLPSGKLNHAHSGYLCWWPSLAVHGRTRIPRLAYAQDCCCLRCPRSEALAGIFI